MNLYTKQEGLNFSNSYWAFLTFLRGGGAGQAGNEERRKV